MKRSTFGYMLLGLMMVTPTAVNTYRGFQAKMAAPIPAATQAVVDKVKDLGITIKAPVNCPEGLMAGYDPATNVMILCRNNIPTAALIWESVHHEAIHVAQDCADGLANDSIKPLGVPQAALDLLPESKEADVVMHYPKSEYVTEREAFLLENSPDLVLEALEVFCVSQ